MNVPNVDSTGLDSWLAGLLAEGQICPYQATIAPFRVFCATEEGSIATKTAAMDKVKEEIIVLFHAALLGRTDVLQVQFAL
jgi:hypothetical protein